MLLLHFCRSLKQIYASFVLDFTHPEQFTTSVRELLHINCGLYSGVNALFEFRARGEGKDAVVQKKKTNKQ